MPGAPGEAMTDALSGAGEGAMAFSEDSLCVWHGAGNFYTHAHFLLPSTRVLRTEAVLILPSSMWETEPREVSYPNQDRTARKVV